MELMWKSKLLKRLLSVWLLSLCFALSAFSQEDSSDLEEFQELASSLSAESYQQELTQIKSLTASLLQDIQQSQYLTMDSSLVASLEKCEQKMSSSEYQQMKLSEQLKVIKESQQLSTQLIQDYLQQQEQLSTKQLSVLKTMNELLSHYDKLLEILQKITNSQQSDIAVVVDEMASSIQTLENVKAQLQVCRALAEQQAEEIDRLNKMQKRLRVLSYAELFVGIPCLAFGLMPIWNDSQKNIQNMLLGIGGTATASGILTFAFTIKF